MWGKIERTHFSIASRFGEIEITNHGRGIIDTETRSTTEKRKTKNIEIQSDGQTVLLEN